MTKDKAKFTQASICILLFTGTCFRGQLLSSAYKRKNYVSGKLKTKTNA